MRLAGERALLEDGSVARVEWSRLSGNEIEAVLGVLLCREHPTATRVKPSRGDGGIDVWVPEVETAAVFQIKGYTGNVDSTRRRHIKDSWKTLLAYTEERSIDLSAWYLVTPENPTKEQLSWLEGVTSGASFPCVWRGLDFVDGLAANYPEVIDYYLKDGKERLEEVVQRFLTIAGLKNPVASPAESVASLEEIHKALNQFDPHFYYDFSVETLRGDGSRPPVPETTALVAAVQLSDDQRCVTYKIIARFNEATKERPVPGSMKLMAEPGTALHEQIEDWAKFGTPLKDVPANDARIDLPGGFANEQKDVKVTISAFKGQPAVPEVTLRILEPDGAVAAALDFLTEEVSTGIDPQSGRNAGHDKESGLVRYELRMCLTDKTVKIDISVEDATGRSPADMLPGLRFVTALRPPRQLQMSVRNGPVLTPSVLLAEALIPEAQGKLWLLMCESLVTIQEHVIDRILFPDMERYHAMDPMDPMDDIEAWYRAARLLRGESIAGTWSAVGVHLNPGEEPPTIMHQGIFNNSFSVRIGDKTYPLGVITMQVASMRVDEKRPPVAHGDHIDVRFVPGDDDTMMIRLASSAPGISRYPGPLRPSL